VTVEMAVAEDPNKKEMMILANGLDTSSGSEGITQDMEWIVIDVSDLNMPTCAKDDFYMCTYRMTMTKYVYSVRT
jgi:hypothetical protein